MSFQGKVLVGQAMLFAFAAAIYFAGGGSLAGSVLLAAAAVFGAWAAVYLIRQSRTLTDEEMAPTGVFPSATTRAPLLALAAVLLGNGLIVGWWLTVVGVVVLLATGVSYAREYRASGDKSGE